MRPDRLVIAVDAPTGAAIGFLARRGADVGELVGRLRELLPQAPGTSGVRTARALFVLTHDQAWPGRSAKVLAGDGHWSEKADAAIALNAFAPAVNVIQALVQGGQDGEYLMHRQSAQTLLTLAGRQTTIEKVPDLWAEIGSASDPQAGRRAGAELARPWTSDR